MGATAGEGQSDVDIGTFAALDAVLDNVVVVEAVRDDLGSVTDFVVVYANAGAMDAGGRRVADLVGRSWRELYPESARSGRFALYVQLLETGGPLEVPEMKQVQTVDGVRWTGWYHFQATRFDEDHLIFAYRDITEQRERDSQLAHERAETQLLQDAFLPAALPHAEHLEAVAAYMPASDAPMGGDWYDAFPVDGGTCFVLGDVAGHGLRAAAVMGLLRNAARAFADEDPSPARVLARLNRMLYRLEPDETATAVVAVWQQEAERFVWSGAGHPPLLRCRPGEFGFLGGPPGLMLGVEPESTYGETLKVLRPGTTLLFYTDGLIESPHRSIDEGMADLQAFVESLGDLSPQAVVDAVLEWRLSSARLGDDLCVLATRLR
jgi:hypothetical protein